MLGALASALHLELPQPVAQTVGLLADAASPVALFTIGAVLARSQMLAARHKHPPIPLGDYLLVAALKLFLHPLLAERFGADNGRCAHHSGVNSGGFCDVPTGGELARVMDGQKQKSPSRGFFEGRGEGLPPEVFTPTI